MRRKARIGVVLIFCWILAAWTGPTRAWTPSTRIRITDEAI